MRVSCRLRRNGHPLQQRLHVLDFLEGVVTLFFELTVIGGDTLGLNATLGSTRILLHSGHIKTVLVGCVLSLLTTPLFGVELPHAGFVSLFVTAASDTGKVGQQPAHTFGLHDGLPRTTISTGFSQPACVLHALNFRLALGFRNLWGE